LPKQCVLLIGQIKEQKKREQSWHNCPLTEYTRAEMESWKLFRPRHSVSLGTLENLSILRDKPLAIANNMQRITIHDFNYNKLQIKVINCLVDYI
jgi:hypothetical protein